jgi:hypothetical protein
MERFLPGVVALFAVTLTSNRGVQRGEAPLPGVLGVSPNAPFLLPPRVGVKGLTASWDTLGKTTLRVRRVKQTGV